jgi:protein-glucosylgalactosylhydroxylysine glucosidase
MAMSRRRMMKSTLGAFMMRHRLYGAAQAPVPALVRESNTPASDPAYISNGLVGIRPGDNPLSPAQTCVAGFVFIHPEFQVESLSPAPYPLTTDIRINGISVLDSPERSVLTKQHLNMANGELTTEFTFTASALCSATITVCQCASRTEPSLLLQRIAIEASAAGQLEITPQITTDGIPGQIVREGALFGGRADCALLFRSLGDLSQLGIAVLVDPPNGFSWQQRTAAYAGAIHPGQTYTFDTIASLVSSFYHREPDLEAIRLVNWGYQSGLESLMAANRDAWDDLWRSRVIVTGDPDDQRALDCAFFYLHSSNHPSNLNGMAPFGLSSSRYYLGHSFWDTETWSFLPLLITTPETAKSLLQFRLRGLEAAKRVAALFGYRGAQFPWEAAPTDGDEVTPVFSPTGWAEQHIVPDVALAFWQYQMATGDEAFLRGGTWPTLQAVAEWIESRGVQTRRGFEILNIMGPDEASNGLNNSAYVNLACRMVVQGAIRYAGLVGVPVPSSWERIVTSMYLPIDSNGVLTIAEHSPNNAFADLSYLLPFDYLIDPSVAKHTWGAYRTATPHAPLIAFAKAAEAAPAAAMGDRASAGRLFRDSWSADMLAPFGMMREAAPQTHGCFLTNEGSLLRTAMFGFTGLRINEGDWNKYEAALPETWQSIEIERVYVRGERKRIVARHGKKTEILDG